MPQPISKGNLTPKLLFVGGMYIWRFLVRGVCSLHLIIDKVRLGLVRAPVSSLIQGVRCGVGGRPWGEDDIKIVWNT